MMMTAVIKKSYKARFRKRLSVDQPHDHLCRPFQQAQEQTQARLMSGSEIIATLRDPVFRCSAVTHNDLLTGRLALTRSPTSYHLFRKARAAAAVSFHLSRGRPLLTAASGRRPKHQSSVLRTRQSACSSTTSQAVGVSSPSPTRRLI